MYPREHYLKHLLVHSWLNFGTEEENVTSEPLRIWASAVGLGGMGGQGAHSTQELDFPHSFIL
jgi:hypothetical protein